MKHLLLNPAMWFVMILLGMSAVTFAEEVGKKDYFTPKIGISPMTGVFGLEAQFNHIAFDVGLPTSGGIRYYFKPHHHSWFAGIYGSGYGLDDDNTLDGVVYDHYSQIQGGVAGGFRWFWRQRWSLELGASMGLGKSHYSNRFEERTDNAVFFLPVATAGFSF